MLEMSDRDIFVHWKTAKKRKYEVHVLAELNGTTPKAIQEIIDRMAEQEGVEVTDREDNPVDKLEKQAERQRKQSREYKRRVRAEERAAKAETEETKEEQKKMTEEEKKAKKAAYMKKYWARKKAEKTEPQPTPIRPITVTAAEQVPSDQRPDDSELIRKALQNFSIGLEEAIEDQKAVLAEAQRKLTAMEEDLRRCQELMGHKSEEAEDEEQID
jgi:hypothetical protein